MKKYREYLMPIFISLFIVMVFILLHEFDLRYSLITCDLETQYEAMVEYLKRAFMGEDSLLYSFSKGLGGNMISTIAYYLTSPLNLLIIFFKNVPTAISIGIILRFCFANLNMYIYLKNRYRGRYILLFSTMYAFSGYMINFYFNIMWLDIVVLLPLVLKSVDDLIKGKYSILLPIFLGLSLFCSFYLAYMLYIFVFIYFAYEVYVNKVDRKDMKGMLGKLLLSMLLAGLLNGFILLPTVIDMKDNMFRYSLNKDIFSIDFSKILMIFSELLLGAHNRDVRFSPNEANIYFTLLGLVLCIKYFLNPNIEKRKKIGSGLILLLFFCSIFFEPLNLVWHGFSFPNGYNYRFSFLLIFILITIAIEQFKCPYKLDKIKIFIIIYFFIIFCILVWGRYTYLSNIKILISLLFFVVYIVSLNYVNSNKFIPILVILEIMLNFNAAWLTTDEMGYRGTDISYRQDVCNIASSLNVNNRIVMENLVYSNDGFLCGTKSPFVTLSTNNTPYYKFMSNMGYTVTYSTIMTSLSQGPFINSILGVQNTIQYNHNFELYYDIMDINSLEYNDFKTILYISNNQNALSLGYVVDDTQMEYSHNPFENQNNLAKKMSGLNVDIWNKVELEEIGKYQYRYHINDKQYYIYNYFPIPINAEIYGTVYINDIFIPKLYSFNKGIYRVNSDILEENIMRIELDDVKYAKYIEPLVYTLDEENYQMVMDLLREKQLTNVVLEKNKFQGEIESSKEQTLVITIPYEKGWHVKVNGKKVNYKKAYDAFIAIDLKKGMNQIEMVFIPPGLIVGIFISCVGVVMLVLVYRRNHEEKL